VLLFRGKYHVEKRRKGNERERERNDKIPEAMIHAMSDLTENIFFDKKN